MACNSSIFVLHMFFQCVLAAIIIIALRGMFLQVLDLKKLWSVSLIDFVSIKINHYCIILADPSQDTHIRDFNPGIENLILPMLSYPGHWKAVHWLYWNSSAWSSSDVIVILKRCHHVMSYLGYSGTLWSLFYNKKCCI